MPGLPGITTSTSGRPPKLCGWKSATLWGWRKLLRNCWGHNIKTGKLICVRKNLLAEKVHIQKNVTELLGSSRNPLTSRLQDSVTKNVAELTGPIGAPRPHGNGTLQQTEYSNIGLKNQGKKHIQKGFQRISHPRPGDVPAIGSLAPKYRRNDRMSSKIKTVLTGS